MAAPVAAQNIVLPPLSDEVAVQFPAVGRFGPSGFRDRQGCTATLIAPDLVITAAHCASPRGTSGAVFAAGWLSGDYIEVRGTRLEMRHPAYAADGQHRPRNDIALIVLDSPMENVVPIPLGVVDGAQLYETNVALIGYHRLSPDRLSGDFACPVGRFQIGLLLIGCPVINGNSGGPVLNQTENGDWQVVGVVSSRMGRAAAIAVELPDWLRQEVAAHLQQ